MYDLQLRKGGKLFVKVWSAKNNKYSESEVGYDNLNMYLHDFVCFEQGVKLIDVFSLFKRDPELFALATGCSYLSDLINEIKLPEKSEIYKNKLGGIVVSWLASKESGDFNYIDIAPMVHGAGMDKDFDVSSVPLGDISLLPVLLDTTFELVDREENTVLIKSSKPFTLLEVLRSLVDEFGSLPLSVKDCVGVSTSAFDIDSHLSVEKTSIKCTKCGRRTHSYIFQKPNDICECCFNKTREN